jgi:hypothetical protein
MIIMTMTNTMAKATLTIGGTSAGGNATASASSDLRSDGRTTWRSGKFRSAGLFLSPPRRLVHAVLNECCAE